MTKIFPAIDLKQGQCVRLLRGDMQQATIFNENPIAQAKEFEEMGFDYLHIVDLDGAFVGKSLNQAVIKEILLATKIKVQLGGGIRDLKAIENWLKLGVSRVILGTAAAKMPELVIESCKEFPGKIAVGIDAKAGKVAVSGWVEETEISAIELSKRFADCGVAALIYTDIARDGVMQGFDENGTREIALASSIPVIASGGISSIDDVKKVQDLGRFGVIGAIIGRAIYEDQKFAEKIISLFRS